MDQETINKFFKGKASINEVRKVLKWYHSDDAEYVLSEEVEQLWDTYKRPNSDVHFPKSKVFQKIREKVNLTEENAFVKEMNDGKKKKSFGLPNYFKLAASILLILTVGLVTYKWVPSKFIDEQGRKLVQNAKWNIKTTKKGQKLTVFLLDGTKIILNSQSSLKYPVNFPDSNRIVYLTGEAFFEVESDYQRPFSVVTNNLVTTALGTMFNVNAFPEQNHVIVSLAEGKLRINHIDDLQGINQRSDFEIFLNPGNQAVYSTKENIVQTKNFNPNKELSWKDGIIYFEDADWNDIEEKLERWYGVEFDVKNKSLVDKLYTGSFKNENLKNVLESLSFSKDFEYKIEEQKVNIKFN